MGTLSLGRDKLRVSNVKYVFGDNLFIFVLCCKYLCPTRSSREFIILLFFLYLSNNTEQGKMYNNNCKAVNIQYII